MAKGIRFEIDADQAGAQREFNKMLMQVGKSSDKMKALTRDVAKMGRQLEKGGAQGKKSFDKLGSSIGSSMTKLAGIVGAGAAFKRILGEIRREGEEAAAKIIELREATATLAQVSETPTEMTAAVLQAELAAVKHGMSRGAARGLMFGAGSFGLRDQESVEAIASTRRFGADPELVMRAVGKFRSEAAFGAEAGSTKELISAFIAAGGPSDIKIDVIAQQAIKALQLTKGIGAGPDELLGLMSVLSSAGASPEETATQIRALANVVKKEGFGGVGMMAGLEQFQAEKPERFAEAIAGETRAQMAWLAIQNSRELIKQRVAEVAHARKTGEALPAKLALTERPQLTQAMQSDQLAIVHELQDVAAGSKQLEFDNALAAAEYFAKKDEMSPWLRQAQKWDAQGGAYVMGPEFGLRELEKSFGVTPQQLIQAAIEDQTAALDKRLNAIEQNGRPGPELADFNGAGNERDQYGE